MDQKKTPSSFYWPKCKRCDGTGRIEKQLKNLGTLDWSWHTIVCDMPGCHNGKMNLEENSKSFYE